MQLDDQQNTDGMNEIRIRIILLNLSSQHVSYICVYNYDGFEWKLITCLACAYVRLYLFKYHDTDQHSSKFFLGVIVSVRTIKRCRSAADNKIKFNESKFIPSNFFSIDAIAYLMLVSQWIAYSYTVLLCCHMTHHSFEMAHYNLNYCSNFQPKTMFSVGLFVEWSEKCEKISHHFEHLARCL